MEAQIAANKRRSRLLFLGFFVVIGMVAAAADLYFWPGSLPYVLAGSLIYILISYRQASKWALGLNQAKRVDKKTAPELYRTVENLSITLGMPMPAIYLIDDPAPNAFATGIKPDKATVAATTGLVEMMDKQELEGVMAHEMGHIQNHDIKVSILAFAMVAVIIILSDFLLRSFLWGGNRRDRNIHPAFYIIMIVVVILAPIAAKLIQLAISRKREYLADTTGAQTTRYPDGLARALEKIGHYGSSMKQQNMSTAHLFFANPIKSSFVSKFLATHPPIEERVKRLRDLERQGF